MENLFSSSAGLDLLYRYALLSELTDSPDPVAAAALSQTLSEIGTTDQALARLPRASLFAPEVTGVIAGIRVLQECIDVDVVSKAVA